jgi:hypothetical protein
MTNDSHERIMRRMLEYIFSIAQAVKNLGGEALEELIKLAAESLAEQKIKSLEPVAPIERSKVLAERFCLMLNDFGKLDEEEIRVWHTGTGDGQIVNNPVCPCLPMFLSQAENFGFSPQEVHNLACMMCMSGYKMGAQLSGVKFNGRLTENGCWMRFSNSPERRKI